MSPDPASSTALVLVDLQNAFCEPEGSVGRQGRDVGPMVRAAEVALELARGLRAAGSPVFWTRYELRPDYRDSGHAVRTHRPAMREHGALLVDSWDAALWRPAEVHPDDFVVPKSRMSALIGTPLPLLLHDLGVDDVVVAGLTTSMCVESTVRDLAQHDYDVRVVTDAVADFDAERHAASLRAMQFGFARGVTSQELLGELAVASTRGA